MLSQKWKTQFHYTNFRHEELSPLIPHKDNIEKIFHYIILFHRELILVQGV